ncbi:CHAT domain-containing protein [Sphaerospermopsis aphanizomenoides BCCUSP55]|uniref:CHAT domain-containing protein n=1 Tax=Sphaerospermopsis aphanizomenoides TaxID=459663 RepID=UPI001908CF2F|nr:CHAT domain-containing protein [Sphaerospermopsis aphanizomenoides]MBK1987897.1 CHAT domain-containing protein [Sphaerospermopsis aphanizomenoides BCCUSP55]
MDKVVSFDLQGDLRHGFNVTVQIGRENAAPFVRFKGKLPANPSIYEQYKNWQEGFNTIRFTRGAKPKPKKSKVDCGVLASNFTADFNAWLNSPHQEWQKIVHGLHKHLRLSDEVRFIIQTDSLEAQRLPWHLWEWFSNNTPKTEVAISLPEFEELQILSSLAKNVVNILVILGHRGTEDASDLAVNLDCREIQQLPGVEAVILGAEIEELSLESIQKALRSHRWDMLFFAGHSHTQEEIGYLQLTDKLKISLDDLKDSLIEAIAHGLKLAIFNSCNGLGLARQMARLQMPQVIVMRENLPDEVAPDFLRNFLKAYSRGKSLYTSVRIARQALHENWHEKYPGIAWLPVIGQNPAQLPITWYELREGFRSQKRRRQRPEDENALLDKVRTYWVEGVLEKSLHGRLRVELGLEERLDAITHPWGMVWETPEQLRQQLAPGTRVIDILNEMGKGGTLLILGKPGSGKTTTLLELAEDLITHADQDNTLPIPVIVNLSNWKGGKQTLDEWLVQELNEKYRVSKTLSQQWINTEKLQLMLDGLDEVRRDRRDSCIYAINQFIQQHGKTEVVVCSRVQDYETLKSRLQFQGAIYVQPLTDQQIEDYL